MREYATERLATAMREIAKRRENGHMPDVFAKIWPETSGINAQVTIIYLFAEARAELGYARLSTRTLKRANDKIDRLHSGFLNAINSSVYTDFVNKFSAQSAASDLEDLVDLLETAKMPRSERINREAIEQNTAQLILDFERTKLPKNIVDLAKIELRSLTELASLDGFASDEMIASRVKSIVADLLADLGPYIEQEPVIRDSILKFGRVTTHATVFALGLIADSSAVYDLISGPPDQKLIESHVEEELKRDS